MGVESESPPLPAAPVALVAERLRRYGMPRHHNKDDPLDELVFIVLSAQTEEYAYLKTYEALRATFPEWEGLAEADVEQIVAVIRPGGLYRKKARQLQGALAKIVRDQGRPTLAFLYDLDAAAAYSYLLSLPGVSNKTAKCILMYSLRRAVLPVDTHVWRIARRLGWAPVLPSASRRAR
jgi:endonuclease III